jgi:glycosyltransferase involved in cell wall biosynthesis
VRIAHVISGLGVGGAEQSLVQLSAWLQSAGIDCRVVSLSGEGPMARPMRRVGVGVDTIRRGSTLIADARNVVRDLRAFDPDVVQGWMYAGNVGAAMLRTRLRRAVPLIFGIRHSLERFDAERLRTRLAIRANGLALWRPALVVYNSVAGARSHEPVGFGRWRGEVVPNGVDTNRFQPSVERRADLRAELCVGEDEVLVGCVARDHPMKGLGDFCAAANALAANCDRVRFVLVGTGLGGDNSDLAALTAAGGRRDRFHLLGPREALERIYPAFDVLVLSSLAEGTPNVLLEAQACGVPCVATDVGDVARVVADRNYVVPPGDVPALTRALSKLAGSHRAARLALGQRARARMEAEFSLDACHRRYLEIYRSLLDGPDSA